jgi:hypothetical protein
MVSIIDRALTVRLRIQDVIETGCYSLLHHEDLPHYSRRGAGCAALIKRIGLRGIPISWPEHAPRPDMMQTAQTQVAKTRTDGGPSLDPLERSDTRPKGLALITAICRSDCQVIPTSSVGRSRTRPLF